MVVGAIFTRTGGSSRIESETVELHCASPCPAAGEGKEIAYSLARVLPSLSAAGLLVPHPAFPDPII